MVRHPTGYVDKGLRQRRSTFVSSREHRPLNSSGATLLDSFRVVPSGQSGSCMVIITLDTVDERNARVSQVVLS